MTAPSATDPKLLGFLTTADPAEADRLLETLLAGDVDRTIREVVLRKLGASARFRTLAVEDLDDVRSEALLLLVQRLRRLRSEAEPKAIADLRAYAATVAYHACYAYLRRRWPQWSRLKNQVRYLVTHDRELTHRQAGGEWLCATAASSAPSHGEIDAQRLTLRELVRTLLRRAATPTPLDALVNAVAELRGVPELEPVSAAREKEALELVADPRSLVPATLDDVDSLRRLWAELLLLPLGQRTALLLNLRDARGRGVAALLPLTGIASIRRVAEVLELPLRELLRLWKELPLDDLRIAERLGVTRQQVINLRKAARKRLARRMSRAARGNTAPLSDSALMEPRAKRKGA